MKMQNLIEFAMEFVRENPNLKNDVVELIELCKSEIEEGGSESHEVSLAMESIKQLKSN